MGSILAVGRFRGASSRVLEQASRDVGMELERVQTVEEALQWCESHTPHSLLLDTEATDIEKACLGMRAQARHALIPILAVTPEVSELTFAEIFNCGGDDVVGARVSSGLSSRLRRLPDSPWQRPSESTQKVALIVAAERTRRVVLGRVLGNAGYAIQFAVDLAEAGAVARQSGPRLVVVDTTAPEVRELVEEQAPESRETLWIVSTPPRMVRQHADWIAPIPNAALTDSFAPPENVVFLANELGRGSANDQRSSRRLLYGTIVAFRGAGRDQDDHGLTYNISEGGLYVRSLAPPVDDRVWLELVPPRTDRRVRLEAKVVWRRPYGPSDMATVPPGFGVQIADGAKADMQAWARGYGSLAADS